eukprot:IDg22081t1
MKRAFQISKFAIFTVITVYERARPSHLIRQTRASTLRVRARACALVQLSRVCLQARAGHISRRFYRRDFSVPLKLQHCVASVRKTAANASAPRSRRPATPGTCDAHGRRDANGGAMPLRAIRDIRAHGDRGGDCGDKHFCCRAFTGVLQMCSARAFVE